MYDFRNQHFGFELEFSGISRDKAIGVLCKILGGSPNGESPYGPNRVQDSKGRYWKIVKDNSVHVIGEDGWPNELVSPPLLFEDLPLVEKVISAYQKIGAQIDESCGFHVHVNGGNYDYQALKNLIKFYSKYEKLFYSVLEVHPDRAARHAKAFVDKHEPLVDCIGKIRDVNGIRDMWYHGYGGQRDRYSESRYCGMNLHNLWFRGWGRGTVEFRMFNATLDPETVRAYITFALAVSTKALNTRYVMMKKNEMPFEIELGKVLEELEISPNKEETAALYKLFTKNISLPVAN